MIKKILKKILNKFGYTINKKKQLLPKVENDNSVFTMQNALKSCNERGLKINTVIDVGASNGIWSRLCMKTLPNVNYFLVEAQPIHENGLKTFKEEFSNSNYVLAAAGNREGTIYFDAQSEFGGLASESKLDDNFVEVPVITLDEELKRQNLKGPYLLKLDTHGFEIPILEGAKKIISEASLIIIETYNYKLTKDSLRYWEMCIYIEKLGFSPIEMVDFMQRKYDNSFWQMDTFFIPSNSKEFSYNSYE